mmetsp:Transcript_30804/g.30321  ORF Transcript_30804/g.30321 Transcript_30804/m.30321 type:complete len:102 (-) Transcript_30804:566-871(-)
MGVLLPLLLIILLVVLDLPDFRLGRCGSDAYVLIRLDLGLMGAGSIRENGAVLVQGAVVLWMHHPILPQVLSDHLLFIFFLDAFHGLLDLSFLELAHHGHL